MMKISKTACLSVVLAVGWLVSPAASADDAKPPERTGELVRRQHLTKQDFEKLTAEMLKLADELEEKEPESAKILREAVSRARGSYEISQDMDKVAEYLVKGLTELAARTESGVIEKLHKLLRLLREGILDVDGQLETVRAWEDIRAGIDKMILDQKELERISALQTGAAEIERQMKLLDERIGDLIARQQELLKKTGALGAGDAGTRKLGELRDRIGQLVARQENLRDAAAKADARKLPVVGKMQDDLASEAQNVSKALEGAAGDEDVRKSLSKSGSAGQSVSAAAGKVAGASGQMRDASKALEKSDAEKAAGPQQKALDMLKDAHKALSDLIEGAAASTPAGKLAEEQKGLGEKTDALAKDVKKAAESVGVEKAPNLSKAAEEMGKAARELSGQDSQSAAAHEKKALEELKRKRDELAELHRRVREQMAKPTKQQAGEQGDLARRAAGTSEQMKGSQGSDAVPGQQSMQKASESMGKAADQLGKDDSSGANKNQESALEELQRARDMLDEAIAREKEKLQDQAIAKIDAMLEEILGKQQAVSADTSKLHARRGSAGYARQDQLKLGELSAGQGRLGDDVRKVSDMLSKEGTTVVFPSVLNEVREDMLNVSKLLADQQAGPLTQEIQAGIERNLQDMIDALRKELSQRRKDKGAGGGGQGGGGGAGKKPLVPPVAELKMLLTLQRQINSRTTIIAAQKAESKLTAEQDATQHKKLAEREKMVENMTTKVKDRMDIGGQRE